ncbi:helix-turn-helix domain-containing protein [Hymenobacter actinosclerus]
MDKRVKYEAVFRAEALRQASQSRSAPAAARALNISVKLIYDW